MNTFDRAFELVIGHEGGYVDDPNDPGGETKFGISKRAYPKEDIANLTLERAKELYHRDYWLGLRADELPEWLALPLFDYAVNSGVYAAVRALQRAVGVKDDGSFGPKTLAVVKAAERVSTIVNLQAERVVFLAQLPTFKHFGRGWSRRVIATAIEAAR
jgi:lysozyme family protein